MPEINMDSILLDMAVQTNTSFHKEGDKYHLTVPSRNLVFDTAGEASLFLDNYRKAFEKPMDWFKRNNPHNHKLDYCEHCKCTIIRCGTCGNNTCNAGYGIIDGKQCVDCASAYELSDALKAL